MCTHGCRVLSGYAARENLKFSQVLDCLHVRFCKVFPRLSVSSRAGTRPPARTVMSQSQRRFLCATTGSRFPCASLTAWPMAPGTQPLHPSHFHRDGRTPDHVRRSWRAARVLAGAPNLIISMFKAQNGKSRSPPAPFCLRFIVYHPD